MEGQIFLDALAAREFTSYLVAHQSGSRPYHTVPDWTTFRLLVEVVLVDPATSSGWWEVQQSRSPREEPKMQHGELAAVDHIYGKAVLQLFDMCVVV